MPCTELPCTGNLLVAAPIFGGTIGSWVLTAAWLRLMARSCYCCHRRHSEPATGLPLLARSTRTGTGLFKAAVRRVVQLLKLRRKWAAYGRILQQKPRALLWEGLSRRNGALVRTDRLSS